MPLCTLFFETFTINDMKKTRHRELVSNYSFTDKGLSVYGCVILNNLIESILIIAQLFYSTRGIRKLGKFLRFLIISGWQLAVGG
jgi:hypothetical protein